MNDHRRRGFPGLGLLVGAALLQLSGATMPLTAQESPHGDTQRPLNCVDCHTQTAWRPLREPIRFDHARDTGYELDGRHAEALCSSCHLGANFAEPRLAGDDCAACHVDVHQGNLSTQCTYCHTTESFQDVPGVNVHLATSFPLTGAHLQVTCSACHIDDVGGRVTTLDAECVSCHRADYENASTIDHVESGFSTECADCHNTIAFGAGVQFDHDAVSNGFTLVGSHRAIPCASCHLLPGFEPLFPGAIDEMDCVSCHQPDYDREHGGSGFPTTCADCHSVDTWDDASFDHDVVSGGFALLGAHQRIPCESCHLQPGYEPVYPGVTGDGDCVGCHQSDYDREHAGSGFPTTCAECHSVDTWGDATFEQHDQVFPINSGAHAGRWASCADCHTVPDDFSSFSCLTCHEHSQAQMDDKHLGEVSGYMYESSACLSCHPRGRNE